MNSTKTKRWSARRATILIALSAFLALGAGGFAYWSFTLAEASTVAHEGAQQELAQVVTDRDEAQVARDERIAAATAAKYDQLRAELDRSHQESENQRYADLGYESVGDGVYFAWSDSADFSCGRYDCIAFSVIAPDGCPGGMYLEAAIMRGSTQVAWTNETFTGLGRGDSASGFFEDIYGQGDSFRLTEVNCR
jgi:hypothetical protein